MSATRSAPARNRTREKLFLDVAFTKAPSVELDGGGSGDLVLSGYASSWGVDRDGESVAKGAFDASLPGYLSSNPICLWQHDMNCPIGTVTSARTDATGLYVSVTIPNPGPDAADYQKAAYNAIRLGLVKTFSIGGYFTRDVEMGPDGPTFTIEEVELFEVSCVSIPANPDSIFETVMKSFTGAPIAMSQKAHSQMAQLLGVWPLTDPELTAMSGESRVGRYEELTTLFKRAHDGAEPPPAGAWLRIERAEQHGADRDDVTFAKHAVLTQFLAPQVSDEKAGRMISQTNRSKIESALSAHDQMEDHLTDAAQSMIAAAKAHADSKAALEDVLGITDEGTDDGTSDDDSDADEEPNSPKKSAKPRDPGDGEVVCSTCDGKGTIREGHMECPDCEGSGVVAKPSDGKAASGLKAMLSDVSMQLSEQGAEMLGTVGTPPSYVDEVWVYLDDIDLDNHIAYFCCYGPAAEDRFVAVPYTVAGDKVSLDGEATPVVQQTTYVPKGLQFMDGKGVLSVPSWSFADRDTSWDGAAARKALAKWAGCDGDGDTPNAKYAQGFLWCEGGGSSDNFGDYKYPIGSVVDGEPKCVLAAISAAASRANTNNLTELKAPLTTLYNRAAKQFSDSDLKPPWADD